MQLRRVLLCIAENVRTEEQLNVAPNVLDLGQEQEVLELNQQGRERNLIGTQVSHFEYIGGEKHDYQVLKETPPALSREYEITQMTLSTGNEIEFHPFSDLFSTTITPGKLNHSFTNSFKFIRSSLRLRFQTNCTISHVGAYVIYWAPDLSQFNGRYSKINSDPVLVDMATQQSVEITIPWTSCSEFLFLGNTNSSGPIVGIHCLYSAPINSSSFPKVTVFASLVNAEVFGADSAVIAIPQSGSMVKYRDLDGGFYSLDNVADTGNLYGSIVPYNKDQQASTSSKIGTIVLGAAGALSTFSPEIGTALVVAKGVKTTYDVASATSSYIKQAYDWYNGSTEVVPQHGTEEPTSVRNQTFGTVAGCIYQPSLSMSSHVRQFIPPYHLGDRDLKHRLLQICRTPSIVYSFNLGTGLTQPVEIPYEPQGIVDTVPAMIGLPYYSMITPMFRFWRGSIKMRLSFIGSPLMAYQVRVSWFNNASFGTPTYTEECAYREVINVRGTQHHDLLLPYLLPKQWYAASQPPLGYKGGIVTVQYLMPPITIGSDQPLPAFLVTLAAGEDFQLKDLQSVNADIAPVFAEAQMHVRSSFERPFRNITGMGQPVPIREMFEDHMTVEDVCNRFSTRTSAFNVEVQNRDNVSPFYWDNYDYVQSMFRYVRGSARVKIFPTSSSSVVYADMRNSKQRPGAATSEWFGDGMCANSAVQNQILELEFPIMSDYDWVPTLTAGTLNLAEPPEIYVPLLLNANVVDPYTIAAGSDYQLAWLMPPYLHYNQLPGGVPIPTLVEVHKFPDVVLSESDIRSMRHKRSSLLRSCLLREDSDTMEEEI